VTGVIVPNHVEEEIKCECEHADRYLSTVSSPLKLNRDHATPTCVQAQIGVSGPGIMIVQDHVEEDNSLDSDLALD